MSQIFSANFWKTLAKKRTFLRMVRSDRCDRRRFVRGRERTGRSFRPKKGIQKPVWCRIKFSWGQQIDWLPPCQPGRQAVNLKRLDTSVCAFQIANCQIRSFKSLVGQTDCLRQLSGYKICGHDAVRQRPHAGSSARSSASTLTEADDPCSRMFWRSSFASDTACNAFVQVDEALDYSCTRRGCSVVRKRELPFKRKKKKEKEKEQEHWVTHAMNTVKSNLYNNDWWISSKKCVGELCSRRTHRPEQEKLWSGESPVHQDRGARRWVPRRTARPAFQNEEDFVGVQSLWIFEL